MPPLPHHFIHEKHYSSAHHSPSSPLKRFLSAAASSNTRTARVSQCAHRASSKMAMSMQELFYGESEPAYFTHYGRQAYSPAHQFPPPEARIRRMEMITFDLMVPMCCARCENEVRDALLVLGSVQDVVCDPRNQRVTVTGCVDPAQALKQARRVKHGAAFWSDASSYTAHRYEASSHQKSHRFQHDGRDRRSCVQSDARDSQRSHPGQSSRSSSDAYTRSLCPAYRDTAKTYYVSLNPTIATVVETEF